MEHRIYQHQTQKQVLSPQIRQYLKLLQLPIVDLKQAIETEVSENPLLEESAPAKQDERLDDGHKDEPSVREPPAEELRLGDSYDTLTKLGEHLTYDDEDDRTPRGDISDIQKKRDYSETLITKPEGLSEFLLWQTRFLNLNTPDMAIAEEIVGNIDDDGYLRATLEEIAQACRTDTASVERVLLQIQTLDPPGIGARNLQEALLIQLQKKNPKADVAIRIIKHHLDLIGKREWQQIAKLLSVDIEEVKKATEMISHLEPKPGRTFYLEEPIAVTPDATVSFSDEDENKLKIEIHNDSFPSIRISPYYRRLLRNRGTDSQTKVFLRERMTRAVVFLRALQLRHSTLHEITEQLVKFQFEFFKHGFSHLQPLRLKDIAQAIGIHESTVSRAIQGKYISTPQGTIPYKSFFSTKLETVNGEVESQKSIMEIIRKMVEHEDAKKPLSDQQIVKRLRDEGIVIARRTVAKYRDLLKILPSHMRRQK